VSKVERIKAWVEAANGFNIDFGNGPVALPLVTGVDSRNLKVNAPQVTDVIGNVYRVGSIIRVPVDVSAPVTGEKWSELSIDERAAAVKALRKPLFLAAKAEEVKFEKPKEEPKVKEQKEEPRVEEQKEEPKVEEPKVEEPKEEPVAKPEGDVKSDEELAGMSKKEIDEYAESIGIILDGRKSKPTMIKELKSKLEG